MGVHGGDYSGILGLLARRGARRRLLLELCLFLSRRRIMSIQSDVQQQLAQAVNLHQSGHLDMAAGLYREILKRAPKNEHALGFLGRLFLQKGDMEQGAEYSRKALQVNPRNLDVLNNLGYSLLRLKQDGEALTCFDRLLALQPGYAPAHYNRGNALLNLGRHEEAIASYRAGLSIRPNHADSYVGMGAGFKSQKKFSEALDCYRTALGINPGQAETWNNYGNLLKELCLYSEAKEAYDNALRLKPDFMDAYGNRALALTELNRFEEALADYGRQVCEDPVSASENLLKRGDLLQDMGRYDEARACFEQASGLQPDSSDIQARMGTFLMVSGEEKRAKEIFHGVLEDDPEAVWAYWGLAQIESATGGEGWFKSMEGLYARRSDLAEEARITLDFSVGRAMESAGRYDEAFDALVEGNRLFHQSHPFDEEGALRKRRIDRAYFSADLIGKCESLAGDLPPYEDERVPIFIVGMPRSGTTLIEQVLATNPGFHGAGELSVQDAIIEKVSLPPLDSSEWRGELLKLQERGREYLDAVWKHAPDARFISNKMPGNFLNLGILHLMLPNAKFIHAMRDPMDSCFSCFATHFKVGHYYSYDQGALGRFYRGYVEMMRHWHASLPQGRILDLQYEDMVADPEREARRLLEHVGLPWDPGCLRFYENRRAVNTASFAQVRKPIYASSVARWQRFERHLGPLLELVSEYRRPT
jgi:tetratricopeptide (TPR) repeat protein